MELKEYQVRALDAFTRWRIALEDARREMETAVAALQSVGVSIPDDVGNYPKKAWRKLAESGEAAATAGPYVERTATDGQPIPHICFKVPTGGGKTLLAAAALERLNRPTGLVLWMVPSNTIYRQTKAALWNKEHPYRQMLEQAGRGQVKMLEKDNALTASDLAHYLCVMLVSLQSANRKNNKDYLKMFRDSGRYPTLFPDDDDALADGRLLEQQPDLERTAPDGPVNRSLSNVFKMQRPVIVLDEAHKAYGRQETNSDEFVQAINRLNPSLVIELSATPSNKRSNLLVDISGIDLKSEEMIKLPVQVTSFTNAEWRHTLNQAHAELERLDNEAVSLQHSEGRYIRPIAVVRVENTGKAQLNLDTVHSEDVRKYLVENLGVPANSVAVQTSEIKDLDGVDLLSELSPVRWIITKDALREGWDCAFAYLLVLLDNTQAKTAITQLMGRVMRQHNARRTGREPLDQCYVYCRDTDVNAAVQYVKDGLEQEGMTGLDNDVRSGQPITLKSVTVQRRERFQGADIFLPKVLHRDLEGGSEELDYQKHILPGIDWGEIEAPDPQSAMLGAPQQATAAVDVNEEGPKSTEPESRRLFIDTGVKITWYARRLSDIMPNPWQAARVAQEFIQKMRDAGQTDDAIYDQRSASVDRLLKHVAKKIEEQSEQLFHVKLAEGDIRFDLETSDRNHRIGQTYEILVADTDTQLQNYGQSVQLSLFEPVFGKDFNELERRFAFYLDQQKALQWWHRVAVRQHGDYYLRGWKQERIWPDFIAMAGSAAGKPHVLVFETKGEHLRGNPDTAYKRRVLETLEGAFNAVGTMEICDGPAKGTFRLVFSEAEFPQALVNLQWVYTT